MSLREFKALHVPAHTTAAENIGDEFTSHTSWNIDTRLLKYLQSTDIPFRSRLFFVWQCLRNKQVLTSAGTRAQYRMHPSTCQCLRMQPVCDKCSLEPTVQSSTAENLIKLSGDFCSDSLPNGSLQSNFILLTSAELFCGSVSVSRAAGGKHVADRRLERGFPLLIHWEKD